MKSHSLFLMLMGCTAVGALANDKQRIRQVNEHATQPGLHFKENKNQWHENVLYRLHARGIGVFLERTAVTYLLYDADAFEAIDPRHKPDAGGTVKSHAYRMELVGASEPTRVEPDGRIDEYFNYFIGNDPTRWAGGVRGFTSVLYRGVYPGIDMRFYVQDGFVKYDFIVHPRADASRIKLRFTGADGIQLKNGHAYVQTSVGHVVEMAPVVWQQDGTNVKARYRLHGNELSFEFPNGYNAYQQLTIDPTLIFSTYTGSTGDNFGFTATYDNEGNMYLGGLVNASGFNQSYPTTLGAFQTTFGGGTATSGTQYPTDMGITKFNATGTARIYSTYLGGNDNDTPHSMFVNSLGQLVVYGRTYSSNFPTTPGAYDTQYNGAGDINITVFNVDGTALVGSTFIGGNGEDGTNFTAVPGSGGELKRNYADDARGEVVCDANNNIYVASCTFSNNFPTTAGAIQQTYGGNQDGVLFKLNADATSLIYSTFLGGAQADACYSLDIKTSDGSVYVTGGTRSNGFPATAGGLNPTYLGGYSDGFLLRVNPSGTAITNSTFVGTDDEDQAYFVKLDLNENVYVTGTSRGDYPVTPGVYVNPNSGQFITRFNPTLSNIEISTVVGNGNGEPNISMTAFLVDSCENVYLCGWGGNLGMFAFQTNNMFNLPVTNDALKATTDGGDFYIFVLNKDAQNLLYGSYFGGNAVSEHVDGGTSRFDPSGVIYEAVCASCGGQQSGTPNTANWFSFGTPVTSGVIGPTNNSTNCNALGFKLDLELTAVKAAALADPAATGCAPLTVTFINNSVNATAYHWNFGTGNAADTSVQFQPVFTFDSVGVYSIMLIAYSATACVPVDTAWTSVIVLDNITEAEFTYSANDMCDSLVVQFNVTTASPTMQFNWDFGDGTGSTASNPVHSYTDPGEYTVVLAVYDSMSCNPVDTFLVTIPFVSAVRAYASFDSIEGCAWLTVQYAAAGFGATQYTWFFGDGTSSTDSVTTHVYQTEGTYTAMLVAYNPDACNVTDTAFMHVNVLPAAPWASFTAVQSPDNPKAFTFVNGSVNATQYFWTFGDGANSTAINPTHTYSGTGEFEVCLLAVNTGPCPDDTCARIEIALYPAVDVPNAFSPNGDGQNDVLYVRGFQVQTMLFRVFNRWGEKVFETTDISKGWDGTYKKEQQEMDVYAWTLNAVLLDGQIIERKGNVTLIR